MILTLRTMFSEDAIWTHRKNGMISLAPLKGVAVSELYNGEELINTKREVMFDIGNNNYSFNFTANNTPYGDEAPELERMGGSRCADDEENNYKQLQLIA